jgi:hypothetical protein
LIVQAIVSRATRGWKTYRVFLIVSEEE